MHRKHKAIAILILAALAVSSVYGATQFTLEKPATVTITDGGTVNVDDLAFELYTSYPNTIVTDIQFSVVGDGGYRETPRYYAYYTGTGDKNMSVKFEVVRDGDNIYLPDDVIINMYFLSDINDPPMLWCLEGGWVDETFPGSDGTFYLIMYWIMNTTGLTAGEYNFEIHITTSEPIVS